MYKQRVETEQRLLAQVAWLYYKTGLTQQQIANRLGITRAKVIKLLAAALDEGVVRISITSPYVGAFELEQELCARFALSEAIVVPKFGTPEELRRAIATAGASYVERVLTGNDVLGTAWGWTVFETAQQIHPRRPLPGLTVVQLIGGLTDTSGAVNPLDIAQLIADKCRARYLGLFAPAMVSSKHIRDMLLSDHAIDSVFRVAKRATKALVGIGPADETSTLVRSGLTDPESLRDLVLKGAVGDIVGRFFDIDGRPVESELSNRTISLELSSIKDIPCVIGVAGGPNKVRAILGALRGGYLDVLITDEQTASALLLHDLQRD